jgi:hypothetical protein
MFTGHHYQNGYVTRNIEKAIATFREHADAEDILAFEVPFELTTPKGKGTAVTKLAFVWVDDLQYELIEPVSGLIDVYTEQLPDDDSLRFHHSCMRVPDWDDFRARVDEKGYEVAIEGGSDLLKFLYIDARADIGHYLEYVWMTDERWTQMGGT